MEAEILHRLHDSKINFKIISYHEKDWLIEGSLYAELISKEANKNICWVENNFAVMVKDLANQAALNYPESQFAKWWNNLNLNKQEK